MRHGGGARALEADRGGERAGGRPAAGRPPRGSDELGSLSRRIAHSGRDGAQPHHDHAGPRFDPEADGHAVGDVVGVRIGRGDPGGHLERAVHPGQVPGCRRHGARRHGEGPRGPGAVHPAPRVVGDPGARQGHARLTASPWVDVPRPGPAPSPGATYWVSPSSRIQGRSGPVQVRQQAHASLLPDPVLHAEVRSCRWGDACPGARPVRDLVDDLCPQQHHHPAVRGHDLGEGHEDGHEEVLGLELDVHADRTFTGQEEGRRRRP